MEKLGIKFSDDADFLERSIDKAGICVYAPLFLPKNVQSEKLGKTF
jgi:anthranilate phosphoribosyltransferase